MEHKSGQYSTNPHRLQHLKKTRSTRGNAVHVPACVQEEYKSIRQNQLVSAIYGDTQNMELNDVHYSENVNNAKTLHYSKLTNGMRDYYLDDQTGMAFEERMESMFDTRYHDYEGLHITTNGTTHFQPSRVISDDSHYPNLYYILDMLGSGTFGCVYRVYDRNRREIVALKFLQYNESSFEHVNAEISILQYVNTNEHTKQLSSPLLNFFPQNDLAILVLPFYKRSLQSQLDTVREVGLPMNLIRHFGKQMFEMLRSFRKAGVIHADLKPDNLMLDGDKLIAIDFGAAVHDNCPIRTYLQSRYYRAPEITLQCGYYNAIDMWSVGCILAELFQGVPMFPAQSSYSHIARLCMQLGPPSNALLLSGHATPRYFARRTSDDHFVVTNEGENAKFMLKSPSTFSEQYKFQFSPSDMLQFRKGWSLLDVLGNHRPKSVNLQPGNVPVDSPSALEKGLFCHLLQGILRWDPSTRWSPEVALQHPFFTGIKEVSKFNAQILQTDFITKEQDILTTQAISQIQKRMMIQYKNPHMVPHLPEVELPKIIQEHFSSQIHAYKKSKRKNLTNQLKMTGSSMICAHRVVHRYAEQKKLLESVQSDPIPGLNDGANTGDINEASFDEESRLSHFTPSEIDSEVLPVRTVKEEELLNPAHVLLRPFYYQLKWKRSESYTSVQLGKTQSIAAMPKQMLSAVKKLLHKRGIRNVQENLATQSTNTLVQIIKLKLVEEQSEQKLLGAISLHVGEYVVNPLQYAQDPSTDDLTSSSKKPPLPSSHRTKNVAWLQPKRGLKSNHHNNDLLVTKMACLSDENAGKLVSILKFKEKQLQNGKKNENHCRNMQSNLTFATSFTSSLFGYGNPQPNADHTPPTRPKQQPTIRPSPLTLLKASNDSQPSNTYATTLKDVKLHPFERNQLLQQSSLIQQPPCNKASPKSGSISNTVIPTLKSTISTPPSPSTSVIESFRKLQIQQLNSMKLSPSTNKQSNNNNQQKRSNNNIRTPASSRRILLEAIEEDINKLMSEYESRSLIADAASSSIGNENKVTTPYYW